MASEFEELKLQVTFQDNASAQLKALISEFDKLNDYSNKVSRGFRDMNDNASKFSSELVKIAGAFGLGSAAGLIMSNSLRGFGEQLNRTNQELEGFSRQMINLENASRVAGVLPDQFKGLSEQLENVGYTTNEAERELQSFFRTIDEAGRAGTAQFQRIWREAWDP